VVAVKVLFAMRKGLLRVGFVRVLVVAFIVLIS
jgi:hypothetical protein